MPFREVIDGYFIACFVMIALKIVQLFYSIVLFIYSILKLILVSLEDIIMTQKLCIASLCKNLHV